MVYVLPDDVMPYVNSNPREGKRKIILSGMLLDRQKLVRSNSNNVGYDVQNSLAGMPQKPDKIS